MNATHGSCGPNDRSIDRILARRRKRKLRRVYTRAPDVLHGDCRLDAIYREFGDDWVESTAFVERAVGRNGDELGWTVATFDERFLDIVQGVSAEVADSGQWLDDQLGAVRRVIALDIGGRRDAAGPLEERQTIRIRATRPRLRSLEREHLKAARDRDFGRVSGADELLEERLLQSRVDVMSLICLCARLG
jgi:hypothetical protein